MLSGRLLTRLMCRRAIGRQRRTLLSSTFALTDEWAERHEQMKQLGLGGDYEWIAAVQKKYVGDGFASAIDVDAVSGKATFLVDGFAQGGGRG
jgi:hypothetical protein